MFYCCSNKLQRMPTNFRGINFFKIYSQQNQNAFKDKSFRYFIIESIHFILIKIYLLVVESIKNKRWFLFFFNRHHIQ